MLEILSLIYAVYIMIQMIKAVILVRVMMKVMLSKEIDKPKRLINLNVPNTRIKIKRQQNQKIMIIKDAVKDINDILSIY